MPRVGPRDRVRRRTNGAVREHAGREQHDHRTPGGGAGFPREQDHQGGEQKDGEGGASTASAGEV